ncbi:Transcription elongation factor S-II central domain [Arabidopsis thaliana x Arabidopsis arenosa]|uniref:Transcription elongation factor S-II central domain n=1 Tax=Arabidopsis thaliana x Arabidopsis arenosa TaxID=1240361 RepID=A0A8T1YZU0_9BRAS|nr:Transcription elongation factor S-II central domain [Arabidopsis thaliana x Arabidopsis arenosa]
MSSNMGTEHIDLETLKEDSDTFGETNLMEIVGSNDQHISVSDLEQEPMETSVSGPLAFRFEPEDVTFQSSMLVDTKSLMPQLQLPVADSFSGESSVAACSILPGVGKRKSPPESIFGGSAASEKLDPPNKRVEPVHQVQGLTNELQNAAKEFQFPHSKLEGKLVFNGGSNGETATRMENALLMLRHSLPLCFWPEPGPEMQEREVGYTKDVLFTPSLRGEDTFIMQLEDGYKMCMCNYMVQRVLEVIMKGNNPITCYKLGLTQDLKLTRVCLLYSYIGLNDSWTQKFSKDWWFKFKIMVIWLEVVSCLFLEGYVSGVSLVCSATGWTTKSDAGNGQQDVYEQILIVNEQRLQPSLVIQPVMRNESIKLSKWRRFKYKYWCAIREKLHMTGMDVTAIIFNRFLLQKQKQRKCKKTWMFKYKPETQQKEWINQQQHIVPEAFVFDPGGSTGNLQCTDYEWLGAYAYRDLRSGDYEEWSAFIFGRITSAFGLVPLCSCRAFLLWRGWPVQSIERGHMPPPATLSPRTEHPPTSAKRSRQMEPASQKSGKQVMNKKQSGLSQGSVKTQNDGNESLRSKMKESLAAALALVHEHEESPKEKKNSETEEASIPVAESNEPASADGTSVTVAEDITPALSTRDDSFGQKNGNGRILSQESSNDTKMNYVNQSDVQKTQFDEVFPCDDVRFSDSIFSGDELLQGNGLSWVLEPVSDFGENETQKSFEDPDLLASKIELELFKLFGGVNKKYKEKGRSLLFNLKDKNNPELRESVMSGKISPERLCNMTAEELASKELSQWRQAKAEEMAEMVVLRDADIDVRNLVRKTHKGEFQVEIDPVDSGTVDVSAEITSHSKPRAKAKSAKSSTKSTLKKNDSNDKNIKFNQGTSSAMTLPPTEEIDPMQGLSMDDEMKDVGFLPPIVSLDEFMESLNSEPPFGSPHEHPPVKEEPAFEKSDSKDGSHSKSPSRSPKQSPKEPSESVSSKTELEKTDVTSPKPDAGVKLDADVSKPENTPLVDSIKEDRIWDGILQLSAASVVSVTGIFKSGEKAKTSEWPTMVEVKGRVRLSAFGKFVKELPLSRSRVLMRLGFPVPIS